jgi:hypothetical protein
MTLDQGQRDGINAKLDRADEHMRSLTDEITTYFESEPHTYRTHVDLEAGTYRVTVAITRLPPIRLAIICGDFAHNLRAALDHSVYGLVSAPTRKTAFPIYRCEEDFTSWVETPARKGKPGPLTGLDPDGVLFARIVACQPFRHVDGPDDHPLEALQQLSNADKHRTILTSVATHRVAGHDQPPDIDFTGTNLEFTGRAVFTYDTPLQDGDEFLRGEFRATGPQPRPELKGNLLTDLAFGDLLTTTHGLNTTRLAVRAICEQLVP